MWREMTVLVLSVVIGGAAAPPGAASRRYDTPYYVIHTDLPPEGADEAVARMTRLGEDLRQRTRELGFGGRIERRLPFYLYARHADYVAAAKVPETSAGVFLGDRLVAAAADARGNAAWHVVQHEAFHQFADAAPGAPLPAWINEGFGEYFGEALFTGDGYVAGVVPPWRLARVKQSLRDDGFPPLAGFALLSQDEWNRDMTIVRYDQAWSLVQFLLHDDGGIHRDRVIRYVKSLGAGKTPLEAWAAAFGDCPELESRWERYWLDLPDDGTPEVKAEATIATVTSFVARAAVAGQAFESFDGFAEAARDGSLRLPAREWLPASLLGRALDDASTAKMRFQLTGNGNAISVVAQLRDGKKLAGRFVLTDGRVSKVEVAGSEEVVAPGKKSGVRRTPAN